MAVTTLKSLKHSLRFLMNEIEGYFSKVFRKRSNLIDNIQIFKYF